jgi:hypothetical protein
VFNSHIGKNTGMRQEINGPKTYSHLALGCRLKNN